MTHNPLIDLPVSLLFEVLLSSSVFYSHRPRNLSDPRQALFFTISNGGFIFVAYYILYNVSLLLPAHTLLLWAEATSTAVVVACLFLGHVLDRYRSRFGRLF